MCVCVCVCVSVCVRVCACVCVCVGRGEFSQPASHGGDLVAVGSRLPEKIHSSFLASCFPGAILGHTPLSLDPGPSFSWGTVDGEFLLGTYPAGQAGC